MKFNAYIINSPDFPQKKDFDNFQVWCSWEDFEEVPFLKNLCSSETEFEDVIIKPYEDGKKTYYPIPSLSHLLERRNFLVKVSVQLSQKINLTGYVATDSDEIVAISIWPDNNSNDTITVYSAQRAAATDHNPMAIKKLAQKFNLSLPLEIAYNSSHTLPNEKKLCGVFNWQ